MYPTQVSKLQAVHDWLQERADALADSESEIANERADALNDILETLTSAIDELESLE